MEERVCAPPEAEGSFRTEIFAVLSTNILLYKWTGLIKSCMTGINDSHVYSSDSHEYKECHAKTICISDGKNLSRLSVPHAWDSTADGSFIIFNNYGGFSIVNSVMCGDCSIRVSRSCIIFF